MRSSLLDDLFSQPRHATNLWAKTIQVVLTHFQLDLALAPRTIGFQDSQTVVYSHPNRNRLFRGKSFNQVNIDMLMHVVNFFKFHLTSPTASTLFQHFSLLNNDEAPAAWNTKLDPGSRVKTLGKRWLGCCGKNPILIWYKSTRN